MKLLLATTLAFSTLWNAADCRRIPNSAEYKGSAYARAIRVERGISLARAFQIATNNPEIEYFVYTKAGQMVLEVPDGSDLKKIKKSDALNLLTQTNRGFVRVFRHGDTVFFKDKKNKWLGSVSGLADTYEKTY